MATTKKTMTKTATKATTKPTTKANEVVKTTVLAEDVVEETVEEIVEETPVIKEKKTFTDSDYILCRSVWSGGLNVLTPSGILYEFRDYGSECDINYRDLVDLIRRGSDHIFLPRFVILDDDFLDNFPTVQKVYGEMYTKEDLVQILELPVTAMKREIEKLPVATKNSMRNLVATQIANGKLDSIAKVRELTTIFNSDFNLLSDLFVK